MDERCTTCGCELAYPTAAHIVDCPEPIEKKREEISEREKVFAKTGGRCAYCGIELTLTPKMPNTMQTDHVEPLVRPLEFTKDKNGSTRITTKAVRGTDEQEDLSNKMPSCRSCNSYKSSLSLENFRKRLEHFPALAESNAMIRCLQRYGLAKIHHQPIRFYFEEMDA